LKTPTNVNAATKKLLHITIHGRVQGVGFRYWAYDQANLRSLAGWVRNRADGAVEALFCGPSSDVDSMLEACRRGPSYSNVTEVVTLSEVGGEDIGKDAPLPFEIRR
jgi:acylphosphatase